MKNHFYGKTVLLLGTIFGIFCLYWNPIVAADTALVIPNGPHGEVIQAGSVQIERPNSSTTRIYQSSPKAVIEWEGFSVSSDGAVEFYFENPSHSSLNRVVGSDVSQIQGEIQSNGNPILVNPNGIVFSKTAQVHTASFIASTLDVATKDYLQDQLRFLGEKGSAIINSGEIKTLENGHIALIATTVINEGKLVANSGTVAMVAADEVVMDLGGVVPVQIKKGAVDALIQQKGAITAANGQVIMAARAASDLMASAINHGDIVSATSLTKNEDGTFVLGGLSPPEPSGLEIDGTVIVSSDYAKGGKVQAFADRIEVRDKAHIAANGKTGGGEILIGGDVRGSRSDPPAVMVSMDKGAKIEANGIATGDGGKVILWSDVANPQSKTIVKGKIEANAGLKNGAGGFVETSGRITDVFDAKISAKSTNGIAGEWLIDPIDLTIDATGNTTIQNTLNAGTSLTIDTTGNVCPSFGSCGGGTSGHINYDSPAMNLSLSPPNDVTFSLIAGGNIGIEGTLDASGGANAVNVVLTPGAGSQINVNSAPLTLITNAGNISLNGTTSLGEELIVNHTGNVTFSNVIAGGKSLTKQGFGTLTLSADNTYSGGTTVSGGILQLGSGGTSGSVTGNIVNNANVTFNRSDALNYAGVISGTGSLTMDGGTFRLTNDNTYTGATILNGGILNIGTSGGSTGSIASQSILFNGGSFYILRNGDLTYSGIMSGSGSGQFRDYGQSGTLTLSGNSTRTSGTHFRGSRTIKLTHGNALGNSAFVFLLNGNSLVLSGGITTSFGNVNMYGTGATGINGALFSEAGNNVLGGGVSVRAANVTVGVDSGSTLTINGGISETVVGGLTKLDAGTLTLAGSSTITGDTTVSAGTLQIGSGGTSGSVTGNIVNNANVTFNRSNAHTYSGVMSGTGTVTKLASNTLTFDGDNTYTGDTTVSAGTLQIGAGGTSGSIAGNIISNSNVTFSRSDTHIYAGVISGTGSLTNDGGFFRLTNDNTYTGSTILTSGQIQIGAPGGSTGSIASQSILFNGGNFSIRRDGDITYSGIMSGSGSFQAYGSGTLTLTGNSTRSGNSFFGGTRTIKLTHGNALGTGQVTIKDGGSLVLSGGITASSGQLNLEGTGATGINGALFSESGDNVYGGSVRLVTTANVEIGVDSGRTLTINGGISESGGARSLTKSDDGTLTLAGSSTFSGGTTVSQGTLKLTNGSALGTGANTVNAGTSLVLSGGITASAGQLTISGDGVGAIDGALFSEAGNNTYNGAIVLAADADFGADSGSTITFGNTINDNGGGFRFIGAGSGDFVFNGIVGGSNLFQLDIQRGNNVTFNNSVTTTDLLQVGAGAPVTGSIAVNADLTAGSAGITFNATGGSSQSSGTSLISPAGLLALQGGNHSLTSPTNNVSAVASIAGDVDFVNSAALQVGIPGTVGMQNTGIINVSTVNGNINIVDNISSTDTGSSAITFNAGSGSAAGTSGGGDIILSNSSVISPGTGGRATLYTGSVAGSTVLASAIGSGSGRFRYGSDEATTNYTTALGSGNYLIYREQPTVSYAVNNVSKIYDGVTFTTGSASGASTGLINGDLSFLSSTPFFTGSAIGATYPGSYVISVPSTTFSDLGYSAGGITNGTLTIGQKVLSVSPQFFTKTYDTNTSIAAASWSANTTGLLTGDDVTITGAPVFSSANAGTNTILQGTVGITGTDSSGYSLVWSNGTGQINQAALTVTAVNDAKLIGQTDITGYAGVIYSGFLGADGPSVFSAPITVTRTNSSINTPGSYTGVLRPSTALTTATNYTITGVNGDYNILPAGELLVRYANQTVTYGATATPSLLSAQYRDGSSNLLINLAPPVVSGNQYTFTDPFGGVAQFEVGANGATTSSSGNVSVGAYNMAATTVTQTSPNFSNNLTVVGGLTVTPAPITTSFITFSDKVYDGTTLATATSGVGFAGVLTGDQVQIAGSFTFADKNVGTNKSVTASGMTISGADSANYYLSAITGAGTASITPVQIDVSGLLAEDKIFDGTTAASISDTSLITNSFFSADNVSISSIDATFSDPAIGDKKTVTVSSINLGGSDAGNYVFNTPVQLLADIDALFIRLQGLTNINKTYDSTNQLPSGEVGYRLLSVLPEGVSLIGEPEYDSREGGLRQITQGSLQVTGISSEGYSLSWENGDGIIYGVPLQVTIHDASKTFGAEDPTNYRGFSISGFVGTDTMDDLIGIPSVVRTNEEVEAPGVYADVLTLGGVRSGSYIFQYDLGDFAIGPDIQDLEIAGRTFSETQAISSSLSNLRPQNIDLIADSSVSYTEISSASGVSFENIRDQSGLSFETQSSSNIEDSGSTSEKADSKTIPGFFASIPDQLLKVFVVDGGIKLPEYSDLY